MVSIKDVNISSNLSIIVFFLFFFFFFVLFFSQLCNFSLFMKQKFSKEPSFQFMLLRRMPPRKLLFLVIKNVLFQVLVVKPCRQYPWARAKGL